MVQLTAAAPPLLGLLRLTGLTKSVSLLAVGDPKRSVPRIWTVEAPQVSGSAAVEIDRQGPAVGGKSAPEARPLHIGGGSADRTSERRGADALQHSIVQIEVAIAGQTGPRVGLQGTVADQGLTSVGVGAVESQATAADLGQ